MRVGKESGIGLAKRFKYLALLNLPNRWVALMRLKKKKQHAKQREEERVQLN